MPKQRTLSDEEIGMAKAMLRKGWRNDMVHFYFNRPDRLISSGRIAQIKAGKYGASVEEASPEDLQVFVDAWETAKGGPPRRPEKARCRPRRHRRGHIAARTLGTGTERRLCRRQTGRRAIQPPRRLCHECRK